MKIGKQILFIALAIFAGIYQISATTVFPIATNAGVVEIGGGIASSGTNYLVSLLSGTNVCAQLVSTNGALIGLLTTNGHGQGMATFAGGSSSGAKFPSVAFGSTNYLQVWYDTAATKAYGQIIRPNSSQQGVAFLLSSSTNMVPEAVASDHTNFLVVLEDYNRNIYGQLVTSSGTLSGPAFLISSQVANGEAAAATFGKTNFLVIWSSQNVANNGNTNVFFGAFVSQNGAVSSPIQIGQTPAPDWGFCAVAFDGTNYLAAWQWDPYPETFVNVTNWEVLGRLISQTGTFPGNEVQLVTEPGNDQIPTLAFDGSDYLLAWSHGFNVITNTDTRFQFLDRMASPIGPEFSVFTAQGTNTPAIAFNGLIFDGSRYVAADTLTTSGFLSGEVYGAFITASPPVTSADQFTYTTNDDSTITITGYIGLDSSVIIPDSINGLPVTSIGDFAFELTSLTSVLIPNSVLNIGVDAFVECDNLTSATIGTNVTSIGYGAFEDCPALTSITIPKSVTNIEAAPFASDGSLTAITVDALNSFYSSVGGVLFDKSLTTLIQYPEGNGATSYVVPSTVSSIWADAFSGPSLTSITIPNSVTTIGDYAFGGCTSLTGITIPSSVTNIGASPFSVCSSLTAINVNASNPAYSSVGGVLFNHDQTTLIEYPDGNFASAYTIPNSVTSIGQSAFDDCALPSITIPNSVTSIGISAFYQCFNLTNVTISGSVTSIGSLAFAYSGLTGVYFEGNAPSADSSVFDGFVNGYINATVYYLPGTTGWSTNFDGLPTALWTLPYPLILAGTSGFGVQSNGFSFDVSWATNLSVVVEACTNLTNPVWQPLKTNALTGGVFYFNDSKWTNYHGRFYRIRWP